MHTFVLAFHLLLAGEPLDAPRETPPARITQQLGLTDVEVDYERPAAKGRRIWGGVVAYDKPWSIDASVRFSKDVGVGGKTLAAGRYRLSVAPAKGDWTIALVPVADAKPDAEPAARFKARPQPLSPARERLTFVFTDFSDDKASLELEWEKLRVSIPIATRTAAQIKAEAEELDGAWRSYANAARYMLETEKDFDAGLRYAERSLALKEDWYTLWIKAALLAAKHDFRAAVTQGERAQVLGRQLGDKFLLEQELETALADWRRR